MRITVYKKKSNAFFCCLILLLPVAFLLNCDLQQQTVSTLRSGFIETDDFFEVTGLGAASAANGKTEAQAKRDAADIARIQAYELLVEALQGIGISGNVKLRDIQIAEGKLWQIMQARLKGVREVGKIQFELQEDGSWLTAYTIQYSKRNTDDFTTQIIADETIQSLLEESGDYNNSYSGIIIDLRYEFDFTTVFSPKIMSPANKILFSIRHIDMNVLSLHGGIQFFSSIREAVLDDNGVGEMPLKLVPESYDKETGSIFLSDHDSQRLLSLLNIDTLFKEGKVAFVI